jgi:hypothetical protein
MKYLALFFCILLTSCQVHEQEWRIFSSPNNNYSVEFPTIAQNIEDTSMYASKDTIGNVFAVYEFTPPADITKNQSAKEILRTTVKALAMKKNILLSETIYYKYKEDYVSVDFTGKITTINSLFKGKIILEGKKAYCMYAILYDESALSIKNYNRFISSFRLIN